MMVSFIVIGRNEGDKLQKCLQSINAAIEQYRLEAEMIYVDSGSTDNSVPIAKQFSSCRVYLIKGRYNSAIARNIGVKEAVGANLIFLDGDMELESSFLPLILDEKGNLKQDFVSGNFINHYYTPSGQFIRKDYYRKIYCNEDTYQPTTGGLFAIKRELWESVGGMRPVFKKGQDLDLGYRLAARGHLLLRKKEVMAYHHTVDYQEIKRLWASVKTGRCVYPRALLYRSHWRNKYVLRRMLTSDPTLICLFFVVVFSSFSIWVLLIYPVLTKLAVIIKNTPVDFRTITQRIAIHMFRDFINFLAFLFYYPSNKVVYDYEEV